MFVNLPLAYLDGQTDSMPIHGFLHYFTTNIAQPISSLTVQIYTYAIAPYEDWHRQAWAGAFVLVLLILLLSITARLAVRGLERMNRP